MINIPDEKLREGYWYLLHNAWGFQEDLNKIHPEMADYLLQHGIICGGLNSFAKIRYVLTPFGYRNVEMYHDANLIGKE